MNVMLINPKIPVYLRMPSLPLGLVSIASFLQAHGHRVKLIERSVKKYRLRKELESFRPDVIGISVMSFLAAVDAKKLTSRLRRWTDAPIVWGGQTPSGAPELILREGAPDYVMLGEGEITWEALADALEAGEDPSSLEGLAFLRNGEFVCNPVRPVADLTTFPDIDWTLVEPKKYFATFFHCSKMLYLHASKGCPAACIFCSNKQFHQGCNRCRDPEQIMRDIRYYVEECGADGIYFSDELFLPRRALRTRLCEMLIEKNYDLVWGCQMRLGVLNEEDIKLMYRAGCRWILFGIESGSEERIKSIHKNIDISLAAKNVEWCTKAGITVQASFIIGFPHETPEELQRTIDFAESLNAGLIALNILTPMPNSDIYDMWDKEYPQYKKPETIRSLAVKIEQNATDLVEWNFSDVPTRELRVVHFHYQWKDFIGRESVSQDRYGIAKKMANDALKRMFGSGLKGFFFGTYISAKQFLTVYFYSHCFPEILKKYHLK